MGNVVGTVEWGDDVPGAVERLEYLRDEYGLDVDFRDMKVYDDGYPNSYDAGIRGLRLLFGRERAVVAVRSFLSDAADALDELGSVRRRTYFRESDWTGTFY